MGEWPRHGGQMQGIAERFNVPATALLDFSANINPDGPPETVWSALRAALEDRAVLTAYPDLEERSLREAIAEAVGVGAEQVAVANGFAPMLDAALKAFAARRCLLPVPCFGEYRRGLEAAGVSVVTFALRAEDGFRYEMDALQRQVVEGACDCVLLANPQNPSGAVCGRAEMLEFLTWAAGRGVRVLLDEAFVDYVPGESVTARVVGLSGVVVFRSVTKFYAVPGLRVSYAVGSAGTAAELREWMAPWAITTMAAGAVAAIVGDAAFGERTRAANERRRTGLMTGLRSLGIGIYPGAANFVLMNLADAGSPERVWERMIREHGIVLRSGATFEGLGPGHFRVAVRSDEDNGRLVRALAKVVRRR
jgi:threonine-phosphate decarboxylase